MEKPPSGDPEAAGSDAKPAARKAVVPRPAAPGGYLALARKYRPGAFDEVVGQEAVISTLRNAIEGGRLHHAYLFSGIRGVGKTTVARLFARALNCVKGPTPAPCGACDPCREIAAGTSMDVIELDAASNRGVDDVEPLREAARYAPSRDRNKVFILDEAHMLSNAAFNSLLKILEEPPPRIVWILATTEYRKIPPTVVSRCQHFEFHRVPRAVVAGYLRGIAAAEKAEVSDEGLEVIAATAGGSVRDAVSLLDQAIAYSGASVSAEDVRRAIGVIDRRLLFGFLRLIAQRDASGVLELIATLADGGADFSQFASGLLSTIRDATVVRFSPDAGRVVAATGDEAAELRELGAAFDEDGLLRVFNAILDLPGALRGAPQPRFVLEAAALRLTRLADLTPIEEVIRELKEGGGAPPSGPGAGTAGTPGGPSPAQSGG
ncbi:MAG TPA: DNA polymerase III subunit gamma/tau, partial [Candidatus Saccharimonadales bacterium]|nr:DNA polymerase III subunit gamma/tau [Candidatus Saccharimonadales bacterium]